MARGTSRALLRGRWPGSQGSGPPAQARGLTDGQYKPSLWKWKSLSHVQLFATPRTIQSMEFSRPEYWSGWVAFPFSRGSSQPRNRAQDSHIAGGFFTSWATRETKPVLNFKLAQRFFEASDGKHVWDVRIGLWRHFYCHLREIRQLISKADGRPRGSPCVQGEKTAVWGVSSLFLSVLPIPVLPSAPPSVSPPPTCLLFLFILFFF